MDNINTQDAQAAEKPTATLHEGDGNVLDAGWYYSATELPDEGSVGPYETREEARSLSAASVFPDRTYDGDIDVVLVPLLNAMNALPGIETRSSCCGHGKRPVRIYFHVHGDPRGIFFLTRCVDRRYWEHEWGIHLEVGDTYADGYRPTCYVLSSKVVGDVAYVQMKSLVKNMEYHLNHAAFMIKYDLWRPA